MDTIRGGGGTELRPKGGGSAARGWKSGMEGSGTQRQDRRRTPPGSGRAPGTPRGAADRSPPAELPSYPRSRGSGAPPPIPVPHRSPPAARCHRPRPHNEPPGSRPPLVPRYGTATPPPAPHRAPRRSPYLAARPPAAMPAGGGAPRAAAALLPLARLRPPPGGCAGAAARGHCGASSRPPPATRTGDVIPRAAAA